MPRPVSYATERMAPLAERLDPGGRAAVDAMFVRVFDQLGGFRRGGRIVAMLRRCLEEPIYATATPDVAWSTFIGRINDELFDAGLLDEEDVLDFWRVIFSSESAPSKLPD